MEELLQNTPLVAGGGIAGVLAGVGWAVFKLYGLIRKDSASTEQVLTSIGATSDLVRLLREEVSRLSAEVARLRETNELLVAENQEMRKRYGG
jgi:hypothetical protein